MVSTTARSSKWWWWWWCNRARTSSIVVSGVIFFIQPGIHLRIVIIVNIIVSARIGFHGQEKNGRDCTVAGVAVERHNRGDEDRRIRGHVHRRGGGGGRGRGRCLEGARRRAASASLLGQRGAKSTDDRMLVAVPLAGVVDANSSPFPDIPLSRYEDARRVLVDMLRNPRSRFFRMGIDLVDSWRGVQLP